jgi:hypothetical protein
VGTYPRVTAVLRWLMPQVCPSDPPGCFGPTVLEGEADTTVTVVLPGRRAGLEDVEKLLTSISVNRPPMRS